jgi:hypothetical protein
MASVLVIGSNVRVFNHCWGRQIFNADKNPQQAFLRRGNRLQVIRFFSMLKNPSKYEQRYFARPHSLFYSPALLLDDWWQDCQRTLVDESGVSPVISFHQGSPCSYITWRMTNRPVSCRSSGTYPHPVEVIIIITYITFITRTASLNV